MVRAENRGRSRERGATLVIMVGGIIILLGMSALAVDLVSFYVARNEAQRAADSAALAGASIFVTQGCTSSGGCVAGGPQEAPAAQQARDAAAQNLVAGQAPSSTTVDVSFSYPNAEEPQITVMVHRDSASSNALPTFFAKIFGISSADVSAAATAEAFNPSGSDLSIGLQCLRPFLMPNCDPDHPVASTDAEANANCGAVSCPSWVAASTCYPSNFVDPNTGAIVNPGVYNPAATPPGGIIGEPWQLHSLSGPSQWNLIGYTGSSASQLRNFISQCAPTVIACGGTQNSYNGKSVGPVDQGIDALINASGDGLGMGQDSMCAPSTSPACMSTPFPITGGANNPNPNLVGQTFYTGSTSIATVALYNGVPVPPGGGTVTVLGYMQLFIQDANHVGTDDLIDTIVLNVSGCGGGGSSSTPVVTQGSPIPIRLIHQ